MLSSDIFGEITTKSEVMTAKEQNNKKRKNISMHHQNS